MTGWHYAKNGQRCGPIPFDHLKALIASGAIRSGDLVWTEGMSDWARAGRIVGLFDQSGEEIETSNAPQGTVLSKTACPNCRARFRVNIEQMLGKKTRCKRCGTVFTVERSDEVPVVDQPIPALPGVSDSPAQLREVAKKVATVVTEKAKDTARRARDYATSDDAKAAMDAARRKTQEVGGMAKEAVSTVRGGGSRFLENPLVIGFSMLFCFPIGLFFVWRHSRWSRVTKWAWTGTFLMLLALGSMSKKDKNSPKEDQAELAVADTSGQGRGEAKSPQGASLSPQTYVKVDVNARATHLRASSDAPADRTGEISIIPLPTGMSYTLKLASDPHTVLFGLDKNEYAELAVTMDVNSDSPNARVSLWLDTMRYDGEWLNAGKFVTMKFPIDFNGLHRLAKFRGVINIEINGKKFAFMTLDDNLSLYISRYRQIFMAHSVPPDGSVVVPGHPAGAVLVPDQEPFSTAKPLQTASSLDIEAFVEHTKSLVDLSRLDYVSFEDITRTHNTGKLFALYTAPHESRLRLYAWHENSGGYTLCLVIQRAVRGDDFHVYAVAKGVEKREVDRASLLFSKLDPRLPDVVVSTAMLSGPFVHSAEYVRQIKLKWQSGFRGEAANDMKSDDLQVTNLARPVKVSVIEQRKDYVVIRIEEDRPDLAVKGIYRYKRMYVPTPKNW